MSEYKPVVGERVAVEGRVALVAPLTEVSDDNVEVAIADDPDLCVGVLPRHVAPWVSPARLEALERVAEALREVRQASGAIRWDHLGYAADRADDALAALDDLSAVPRDALAALDDLSAFPRESTGGQT